MLVLNERQDRVLRHFFEGHRLDAARGLIASECAQNLPFCGDKTHPDEMDRIRFAVIKYSRGDFARLEAAVRLAQTDWRDLLLAAGFGDPGEHQRWFNRGFADRPWWRFW